MQLIFIHLFQNAPRTLILRRQLADMMLQVHAHLTFSFCDKTQTVFITGNSGQRAHTKGQAVPDRIEQTGMAIQFFQAVFTPGQMILFFNCRLFHLTTHIRKFRRHGLTMIERLCTHFTTMIDPHQTCHMTGIAHRQLCFYRLGWIFTLCRCRARDETA